MKQQLKNEYLLHLRKGKSRRKNKLSASRMASDSFGDDLSIDYQSQKVSSQQSKSGYRGFPKCIDIERTSSQKNSDYNPIYERSGSSEMIVKSSKKTSSKQASMKKKRLSASRTSKSGDKSNKKLMKNVRNNFPQMSDCMKACLSNIKLRIQTSQDCLQAITPFDDRSNSFY
jgi:hypothetical protein